MRVIFLGTPDFGLPALEKIMQRHQLIACICQPDRMGNRGKVQFCAVKKFALQNNIPLYQFEKISRDGVQTLKDLAPDIMVTAAYGQILSQEVIDIPKHGIINIHGSLLPKLRGASPIQSALLQGFKRTGITILQTVKAVDAGDIILKKSVKITEDDNCGTLFDKLSLLGAEAVSKALYQIEKGTAVYTPQDDSRATFTTKISTEMEKIEWTKPAQDIINLVRAFSPHPGAWTTWNGQRLKIFGMRKTVTFFDGKPGQITHSNNEGFTVMCGDGKPVYVTDLQLQNCKRMDIISFACGRIIPAGTILGE